MHVLAKRCTIFDILSSGIRREMLVCIVLAGGVFYV